MSKKRGLSHDEKRTKMLEVFYEKRDVFQLKELEKICPKEKGITPMSVKEVLQSLVDDDLVKCEKIGTSNYFWCFPSAALLSRKRKVCELTEGVQAQKKRKEERGAAIEIALQSRTEGAEREEVLSNLALNKKMLEQVLQQVLQYKECDPEVVQRRREEVKLSKEAINRWTDNIFSVQSYCRDKFNMEVKDINKSFGIPEELDYV